MKEPHKMGSFGCPLFFLQKIKKYSKNLQKVVDK